MMKLLLTIALLSACAFGQQANGSGTGTKNDSALARIPPSGTYANRPGSPLTGTLYLVTDTLCGGAGTGPAICRYNGSSWILLASVPQVFTITNAASLSISHGLASTSVLVACYDSAGYLLGSPSAAASVTSMQVTSTSAISLTFSGSLTGTCVVR